MSAWLQAVAARGLNHYYNLEEDCLVKKADVSKLLQLIKVKLGRDCLHTLCL
jgi:hypothetical protein